MLPKKVIIQIHHGSAVLGTLVRRPYVVIDRRMSEMVFEGKNFFDLFEERNQRIAF